MTGLDHPSVDEVVALETSLDPPRHRPTTYLYGQLQGRHPADGTEPGEQRRREGIGEQHHRQRTRSGSVGETDPPLHDRIGTRTARSVGVDPDVESFQDRQVDTLGQFRSVDARLGRRHLRWRRVDHVAGITCRSGEITKGRQHLEPITVGMAEATADDRSGPTYLHRLDRHLGLRTVGLKWSKEVRRHRPRVGKATEFRRRSEHG